MRCPYCTHDQLKVTDSRNNMESNTIRRRRECLKCGGRFTTFETVEWQMQVKKRDGRYEDFQQDKLILGLESACRHTKISREQLALLVASIINDLMQKQTREVSSTELGRMVMDRLRDLDRVAYIRFACVYRRFREIDELLEEIQSINPEGLSR